MLKDILVVDVGRKTVDVTLNRRLVTLKGVSYDLGVESIYNEISKIIFEVYNVRKKTYEIEYLFLNNEVFSTRRGDVVDVKNYFDEAANKVSDTLVDNILNDFGDYTYNKIILTGGGMNFYKDNLMRAYNNLTICNNYIYSNALGMIKFILYNSK